jgi:hypothetical protein
MQPRQSREGVFPNVVLFPLLLFKQYV